MTSKKARKPAFPPKFKVGDKVRVKPGIMDVNYPDLPIGGWAGIVSEVHDDDGMYTVRWSKETLAAMHPVYKKRCERDGFEFEEYWLNEEDVEPDPGGPLSVEQPKEITSKPLSLKDQDDRIRMVFGLTSNDPLPDVDENTLRAYQKHLAANLSFPFEAVHSHETGPFTDRTSGVTILGLGDPDDEAMLDDMYGVLCEARLAKRLVMLPLGELEVAKGKPSHQMIADYCYWFWNWR
jgi:uncharacterized protein YodC (DUF2158 family)